MSVRSDKIRETFKNSDDIRDKGLTTPEDIVRFDNIVYGEDSVWQSLDVYRPTFAKKDILPVIVSVHGGGWVYGDKERYQYYCMNLAQRGFAVVNFTYRLAPEYKFPASVEDTNMVFAWVLKYAAEYGLDSNRIFAVGDSAGAHILSIYTAICTNAEYASKFNFRVPKGFVPTAIALNCGVYKIERKPNEPEDSTMLLMADLLEEKGSKKEWDMIHSLNYITENYPPVFLMTSEGDFLKDQALILAERLMEQNVPFLYRYYRNSKYELPHVFHCNIRLEDACYCNDEECDFFKRFCERKEKLL